MWVQALVSMIQYFLKEVIVILQEVLAVEVKENKVVYPVIGMKVDLVYHLQQEVRRN